MTLSLCNSSPPFASVKEKFALPHRPAQTTQDRRRGGAKEGAGIGVVEPPKAPPQMAKVAGEGMPKSSGTIRHVGSVKPKAFS
jgi:hypothetical protein